MSCLVAKQDGENMVLLKGAPERVLEKCDGFMSSNGQSNSFGPGKTRQSILKDIEEQARKGLRIIAVAVAKDGGNMKHLNAKNLSTELTDTS